MTDRPKRRWFQFSIRTVLIATTVFCVWVGWLTSSIRERKQLLEWMLDGHARAVATNPAHLPLPWYRRALGDTYLLGVELWTDVPDDMVERVRIAFPEAIIGKRDKPKRGAVNSYR
jgi:hypothetical protein